MAARTIGLLYLAGATIGLLSLLLPHSHQANDLALYSNIALAYGAGLGVLALRSRVRGWMIHAVLIAGVLVIARAIHYSGEAVSFYSTWFIWIGLFAFYFMRGPVASAYVAYTSVAYALTLVDAPGSSPVARWLTTVATLIVAGVLIRTLVARARRQADALTEIAERAARTDELTGLPNRRAWHEALPTEIERARREGGALWVAILDLDHFKAFNDEHGHLAGDLLLKEAATAWAAGLRATDLLARYGGEEFTLAMPGCDEEEAVALVERLRAALPSARTCSAGLACWDGEEPAEALLDRADGALYLAKQLGRDRAAVATA